MKKKESYDLLARELLKSLKEDEGNIFKESATGIYFKTGGNGKIYTSLIIHTAAGGDPLLFKAWADAQNNPH